MKNIIKGRSIRILIAIFVYISVSFLVGSIFLDFRDFNEENINGFFIEMESPKAYRYINNLPHMSSFCIEVPSLEKKRCFEVQEKLIRIEANDDIPIMILDDHAAGSLIHGTFNLKEVIFSEFIFGHIQLKNFDIIENVVLLWKE